ncbi:MAG: hypothetical protein KAT65_05150 [Methanophagales archaeon]|nr:hypothetical protein [Methanophagales archaeon]
MIDLNYFPFNRTISEELDIIEEEHQNVEKQQIKNKMKYDSEEINIRENNIEISNRFALPTVYRYHRGMRWIPINKKTSLSPIAHHINNNYVAYISKELHENSITGNRILHRKQVKCNIRKINKMLFLKILLYNLINTLKNNDLGNIGAHVFDNEEQAVNVLRGMSEKIRVAEREVRAKKTVESRNDVRETIRNFIKADIDVMLLNTKKINNLKESF